MPPRISPAEWQVLDALWDRAPATAADVYAALCDDNAWHLKTVNTFLARLVEKGVLRVRRDGKANVYAPKLSREQCVRRESDTFLQRVFRGAAGPMLAHFCERADLSDAEIAQLRKILAGRSPKRKVPENDDAPSSRLVVGRHQPARFLRACFAHRHPAVAAPVDRQSRRRGPLAADRRPVAPPLAAGITLGLGRLERRSQAGDARRRAGHDRRWKWQPLDGGATVFRHTRTHA